MGSLFWETNYHNSSQLMDVFGSRRSLSSPVSLQLPPRMTRDSMEKQQDCPSESTTFGLRTCSLTYPAWDAFRKSPSNILWRTPFSAKDGSHFAWPAREIGPCMNFCTHFAVGSWYSLQRLTPDRPVSAYQDSFCKDSQQGPP